MVVPVLGKQKTHDVSRGPIKPSGVPKTIQLWRGDDRGGAETTLSLGKVVPICSGLRTKRARVTELLLLVDIGMSE